MHRTGRNGQRRALVVGAGVAGLAATASLRRAGWDVVLVERALARRTGGYFVRLAPDGLAAAARLGASAALRTRLPADGVITGVDARGRTVSRVAAALADDPDALALVRGDLEAALWAACPEDVDVRFGTAPHGVEPRDGAVDVVLGSDREPERFDLVVGADGVRSHVRALVFGPPERFRHEFDHVVISAVLPRLPVGLREGDYVVPAETGRTAHLMAMAGHDPVVFFTFRADLLPGAGAGAVDQAVAAAAADPIATLRTVYGDFAGIVPEILDGVAEAGTTHVDTVAQIRVGSWRRGRVVLVGDAAWCPTLYSGQGSALALAGGESLGTHLAAHPDDPEAGLAAWEDAHRPKASAAGSAARRSRHFFLPGNRVVAALRRGALRVASWRPAGQLLHTLAGAAAGPPARASVRGTPSPGVTPSQ